MRRLAPLFVAAALALPSSAQAASFVAEVGSPFPARSFTFGVAARDFNGDGLVDVAAVNGNPQDSASNNISIFLRQVGGGFSEEAGSPIALPNGPNYVAAGDFNGDGRQDLAISTFGSSVITVLVRNQTNSGFVQEGTAYPITAGGSAIQTADFNGDGALDLVVGNWNNATVQVYTRQGGTFVQEGLYATGNSPRQFAVGDYNGDGRPDLAVTNWSSASVSILLRNGTGTAFTAEAAVPVGAQPFGIGAGDFNRDGRLDLAVANEAGDSVQLLQRTGSNDGFTATSPVAVPDRPIDLAVADFDSNGTSDVAVASLEAGALSVLSGGTSLEPPISVARAYAPAVADFNADNRPDLAVTSEAGSFTSLLNTTAPPQQPPPPPPPQPTPTPLPEPVAGRNVNATPVEGKVRVKLPNSRNYVDLSQAQQLPVGTSVDARNGTVEIVAAGQGGRAKFFDGIFKISQTTGRRPLTTLTLTEQLSCPKPKKKASSAAAKKKSRKLWGDGKGAFRTKGKYSAATVRGTKWLVTDYCDRTVTRVTQGSVTVRGQGKTKVVRAGKSYTVRKRR